MPIITIQQRMTEVGRIRMGEKRAIPDQPGRAPGRTRPAKLSTFRLTSHSRAYIESAAHVYGGRVEPWDSEQGRQWQVTIEADALDVVIAPAEAFSQWFEMWSGGGCARRCNGMTMETKDGKDVREDEIECMCPADAGERVDLAAKGQACKPTTRLLVWLPKMQGIGVWRAETHGFYAAAELPASVAFLQGLYAQGFRPIASLRMSTREIKRPNEPTKQFPVLELDLPDTTLAGLLSQGMALPGEAQPILGPGAAGALGTGGPAPRQIGAPRAEADWSGNGRPERGEVPIAGGHGEVIEGQAVAAATAPPARASAPAAVAPPPPAAAAVNASPTGAPPARGERRARPSNGTRAPLPSESDMRKPVPAQPAAAPAPGAPPQPFEEMLPFGQDPQDLVDPLGRDEELERIAAEELEAEREREQIAAAAPPAAPAPVVSPLRAPAPAATVQTSSGPADPATGEIAGHEDDGLSPEEFKGMIGAIGAQPRWVVALAHELFPDVADFRSLSDGQRGRLYNEAAARMAAAGGE